MMSENLHEIFSEARTLRNFYTGKTIFITGATGFLGTVLLEKLLRSCPDISKVYILLRSKKGVLAEDRKSVIFKKDIFTKLKATNPDVLKKVIGLSGDTAQDNLGLDENDYATLMKEVSIVFHIAASISLTKPLSFIVHQNVIATDNILELCRKMENLKVLVYTSSAFSNSNQKDVIEEKIYDLPFSPEEIVKLGRNCDNDELMKLYHMCTPSFPNFYTFSKCVAENLLKEKGNDMSICIIRPSAICSCLRGPLPGYLENGSAFAYLTVGGGKGYIRVLRTDKQKRFEIIPADVTANAHIVAAYNQVSKSLPSPSVYNCVYGDLANFTYGDYAQSIILMAHRNPLPDTYIHPGVMCCKSLRMYNFFSLLLHYIPAAIIDALTWINWRTFRFVQMYKYFDKTMKSVEFFMMKDWVIRNKNFQLLSNGLDAEEKEEFSMDLKNFTLNEITRTLPTGADAYRINGKPYKERYIWKCLRKLLTFLIVISMLFVLIQSLCCTANIFQDLVEKKVFLKQHARLQDKN